MATESASGAFTGDRGVLNSEFQSVIQEVNRQAQAIGLNQGGEFATNLNVFVGGGTASGSISASDNGTVSVNLSNATVDAKSLGLEGVQATNLTGSDLSAASATSVQAIVDDGANAQPNDITTFNFAGAGFSGSSAVSVGVNLSQVTDTTTLASAINQAIANAGNGGTAAATAFQNAGITANVVTDSSGGQHIAFSSSNTAFQVQAGDVLANALLGNTVSASNPDGQAIASTVTGGANATSAALTAAATVQIQGGGLASPVNIDLGVGATIATLQSDIAGNATLAAAGITLSTATSGSPLVFSSAAGKQFSVSAAGDTSNVLGLGSFQAGAAGAVQYSTITAGANYDDTTATGTANLQYSVNGAPAAGITVDLNGGDATSGSEVGNVDLATAVATPIGTTGETIKVAVDGAAAQTIALHTADVTGAEVVNDINSQLTGAKASLNSSGFLQITSNSTGVGSSVAVTAGTDTGLADVFGTGSATAGTARSLGSVVDAINQQLAGNSAGLTASASGSALEISSNNGTNFQLNSYGPAGADLGFGVAGAAFTGNTTGNSGLVAEDANGAYQTGGIGFTGLANGNDTQSITVASNDSTGTPQSLTIQLQNNSTTSNAANIDQAVDAINSALQKTNIAALQGVTAVVDNDNGTQKINFLSTNAFTVAVGSTADGTGIQSQGSTNTAAVVGTGTTADISTAADATNAVNQLGQSVLILGDAQAAVGRGENEFTYATNLANSQLTNLAAAESGIRDANMATESANLTKASIQLQAGIAALAQANSAPQQILKLLQQ